MIAFRVMVLWQRIGSIDGAKVVKSPEFGDVVLLPVPDLDSDTCWMVSRYTDQTRLATALRTNEAAQRFVARHRVRFGFRKTDVPPIDLDRQKNYGETEVNEALASKSFRAKRKNPLLKPVDDENAAQINRLSDREENVRLYWRSQTPQSHHIVEFNNLRDINRSRKGRGHVGPLDHSQLPCVLLAAEFHQRYISSVLKPTHGMDEKELLRTMVRTYRSLYATRTSPLRPLWQVSRLILREAGLPVT